MKRACLFGGLVAGVLLVTGAANASDALSTAPANFRKLMDNHRVRVIEATLKPRDKVATHEQAEHLFYVLTDGTLVIEVPGKTGYEMTFTAGESFWLPPQTRSLQNSGEKPVKALIVEVKGGGGARSAASAAAVPRAEKKSRSGRVIFRQRPRRR